MPFPPAWRQTLETRVPLFSRLPARDQKELEGLIQIFLAEKSFEGCNGLTITDEIKVCIAAQACLLLLHRDTDFFPRLRSILVYPSGYYARSVRHLGSGVLEEYEHARLGEAWPEGAVVLAWDAVCSGPTNPEVACNIVLHEFAHFLDFEDDNTNGAPLLGRGESLSARRSRYSSWTRILGAEFEKLRDKANRGEETYMDVYGTTNPTEFFAVATETFFEWPHAMKAQSPEMYEELRRFFCQDPIQWTPPIPKPPSAHACLTRAAARKAKGDMDGARKEYSKAIEINPNCAHAYFGLGSIKYAGKDGAGALSDYDKAISLDGNQPTYYVYRGIVKRNFRDLDGAVSDFTSAINLAPDYAAAYYHRGIIKQSRGQLAEALSDFDKSIEANPMQARTYESRGRLFYNSQQFVKALADFRKESELTDGLHSCHCGIWLVEARLGEREKATRELRRCLEKVPPENRDSWIFNIARFLVEEIDETEFLAIANQTDSETGGVRICAAWFYAGTKRLLDGDRKNAKQCFENCLAAKIKSFAACQSASAELKFLESNA
jgi:MtfA peptidase